MAETLTKQDRQGKINYLLNRAYPRRRNGTRGVGNREFYANLCDQPDNVIVSLYESAWQEDPARLAKK